MPDDGIIFDPVTQEKISSAIPGAVVANDRGADQIVTERIDTAV